MVTPHVLFAGHAELWVSRMWLGHACWQCTPGPGLLQTRGCGGGGRGEGTGMGPGQALGAAWGGDAWSSGMAQCRRAGKRSCGSARFGATWVSSWLVV